MECGGVGEVECGGVRGGGVWRSEGRWSMGE